MVLPLWVVENRPSSLLWPLAYTTACTTVQAVISKSNMFGADISQGSVMTRLRCDGKYNKYLAANLLQNLTVKKNLKSVPVIPKNRAARVFDSRSKYNYIIYFL